MAAGKRLKREKGRTAGRPSLVNTHRNIKKTSGNTFLLTPRSIPENTALNTHRSPINSWTNDKHN